MPKRLTTGWLIKIADLFRTTHKVKTQPVVKSRGQHCGDVELAGYLANAGAPVPLVLDLRIAHERFGSSSDPNLNGKLHYPNDIDRSLNEGAPDKFRKYRGDYNNNPPNSVSFMTDTGNCIFRSSVSALKHGNILPLSPRGVLDSSQIKMWTATRQSCGFTY